MKARYFIIPLALSLATIACGGGQTGGSDTASVQNPVNGPAPGTPQTPTGSAPDNSGSQGGGSSQPASITLVIITSVPSDLERDDQLQLTAETRQADGTVVGGSNIAFSGDNPTVASVRADGLVTARYPGTVRVTAHAGSLQSMAVEINVLAAENTLNVRQVTNNAVDDSWGMNNGWKTISNGNIFWLCRDGFDGNGSGLGGAPQELFLADAAGNVLFNRDVAGLDVDFLALGSGAANGEVMASWREELRDTYVLDDQNGPAVNLGDYNQEENSIADGCLVYRDSTDGPADNNVAQFFFPTDHDTISALGGDDHDPVTSGCEAVWVRDGVLVYFDGSDQHVIAAGPFTSRSEYDFREGQVVYELNDDVFLVDTTVIPFQETRLTGDGSFALESFPRTDGSSVTWIQDGAKVILYEIGTASRSDISTTLQPKNGNTLQIDGKQVLWQETADAFFFYDGSVTNEIVPNGSTAVRDPYLADGLVTWFGQTGTGTDTEIFVME